MDTRVRFPSPVAFFRAFKRLIADDLKLSNLYLIISSAIGMLSTSGHHGKIPLAGSILERL